MGVDIPAFIAEVARGDFSAAYDILSRDTSLPAICGRVCPQENQCEQKCVRGHQGTEPVAIGRLERFVADWKMRIRVEETAAAPGPKRPQGGGDRLRSRRSWPARAIWPARAMQVTIFEALHAAGGVLVYGIPEFRLPKDIVRREIAGLEKLGVKIETNMVIGKVTSVQELMQEYGFEAVFIGTGAGLPKFMRIPGENLKGVFSANEFLTRVNLMKAYQDDSATPVMKAKRVAVVGGGNVAMDAARCAKRLGAEVTIVYRRSEKELPARAEEVEHAKEEGIVFKLLNNPVRILGDDQFNVTGMECIQMTLGEPDESGRRRPVEKPGSEFIVDVDCVIMAIGTSPNPLIKSTTDGLATESWGGIIVDEATGATSIPGVYAGGDAVTGAATVILAMGAGKTAAAAMDAYIQKKQS